MSEFLLLHGAAIVMLILANGFFVAAELALVSVRATRVEQLIHTGDARALLVKKLQENLGDFLPAVQLGVTLCSLALGWIGEPFIADLLRHWIGWLPDARLYGRVAALALAFAGITYFQVLVGELVPKALALHRTDQMVLGIAGPMDFFIRISRPVVRLMNSSAALVLRAFDTPIAHQGGVHSSEELMLMATAARRMGVLPEFEETLIHRSLELDELLTREIMTPRQQMFALPFDLPIEQASARIVAEMHSRIPVYDPARGHEFIVGVVYAKDIARLMHFRASAQTRFSSEPFSGMLLRQVMREVLVVPETKPVLDLLREFQQRRRHLAIVVDEYGSTIGLVTVEDAIEQLIGEVEDEFDLAPPSLLARTSGELVLDGSVTLRDLETQMHWDLPREGGVETLAGFVLTQLGKIPEQGESIVYDGRRLTVMEMEGNRISRIRVQELPSMKDDTGDAAEA
ncbi:MULTISPECIES: hemolysin family protein [Acidobacterium]|uniref:CBS/transporter domain protein n=1 Tax=Acidobacterium capsulatum (strain ATCC 51196 / DSM 11244 / BCRC 80197 / JCM 7670 / NBRC 15755 / NCIMB 13165 / 161) TaxID=240015 RepID=C1F1N4_ACIC5|nr:MULTISPECIES: hemolysin family protein [Acidobacterium]ACO34233.1 CBS/transporter domain protein [Acidobacterium capsulatum ATCC 51196]HCT61344.1 HlyC/CorC family transporter [Acidobacterium sp.]